MGCNCKKINKLGEKTEVKEKLNIFTILAKIGLFLLTVALGLIITPIILVIGIFNAFFRKGKVITIPKFLINPKRSVNG